MKMSNRCENVYLKIKVCYSEVDLIVRSGISQKTDLRGVQSFKQMKNNIFFFSAEGVMCLGNAGAL